MTNLTSSQTKKIARTAAEQRPTTSKPVAARMDISSSELIRMINRNNKLQELNIIVKADVQGSLTSVIDSLKALDTDEVAVRVVGSGVGASQRKRPAPGAHQRRHHLWL